MIKLASMRGISWYVVVFSPKASLDYLVGVKADWKEMCQYLIKSEGARPNLLVNTAAFFKGYQKRRIYNKPANINRYKMTFQAFQSKKQ